MVDIRHDFRLRQSFPQSNLWAAFAKLTGLQLPGDAFSGTVGFRANPGWMDLVRFPLYSVTMRLWSTLLVTFTSVFPALAQTPERLGTVSFPVSCAASQQAAINRGIALVHDFWYEESQRQFEQILKTDPACTIAHWGIAMSVFHQIWNRPSEAVMTQGWSELQKATRAKTGREKEYISALKISYEPGALKYQQRVDLYFAAMRTLHEHHPDDIDAATFYALSLLADV